MKCCTGLFVVMVQVTGVSLNCERDTLKAYFTISATHILETLITSRNSFVQHLKPGRIFWGLLWDENAECRLHFA